MNKCIRLLFCALVMCVMSYGTVYAQKIEMVPTHFPRGNFYVALFPEKDSTTINNISEIKSEYGTLTYYETYNTMRSIGAVISISYVDMTEFNKNFYDKYPELYSDDYKAVRRTALEANISKTIAGVRDIFRTVNIYDNQTDEFEGGCTNILVMQGEIDNTPFLIARLYIFAHKGHEYSMQLTIPIEEMDRLDMDEFINAFQLG